MSGALSAYSDRQLSEWAGAGHMPLTAYAAEMDSRRAEAARSCRICGCTQNRACVTDGEPCHWVGPDLCSACEPKLGLAAGAAQHATNAAAELLRFLREGDGITGPFGDDTVEQLLDAAKMAIEIEGIHSDERAQVYGALSKFLEGWA